MSESKTPEQIEQDFRVAVHELGHYFACESFRIPASPKVFEQAERPIDQDGKTLLGVCEIDVLAKAKTFEKSVIGWAGYVAEHLCGVAHKSYRNPFALGADTLRQFFNAALTHFEDIFSRADKSLICSYGGNAKIWRSFKSCYERLLPMVAKINNLAPEIAAHVGETDLLADRRKWAGVSRPEFFPASHDDFLRLVCAGQVEKFDSFLVACAARHLTNNATTEIDEAKRMLGEVFDAAYKMSMNLQRSIYAGDFPNPDSWLRAARDFQQFERWQAAQPIETKTAKP